VLKHAIGTAIGRPRRWRFLEQLPKGATGAEVGVFRGEFTRHIVRVTTPKELHLIDGWWALYGERFPNWGAYTEFGRLTTTRAYEEALAAAPEGNFHVGDDVEILSTFSDGYFDWVYLDTTHRYEHTLAELAVLDQKARIIAGDDWHEDPSHGHHGVCRAVREFCASNGWRLGPIDPFGQWIITR
jgi:Methyltransferase domain